MTAGEKNTGQAGGLTGDGGTVAGGEPRDHAYGKPDVRESQAAASGAQAAARGAIASLLAGNPPNGTDPAQLGPWADYWRQLAAIDDLGGRRRAFDAFTRDDAGLARLMAGNPPPVDPLPDCIPLPREAQVDAALGAGAGAWLDRYTAHALAISPMTPASFHESAGLWLGSVAIARRLKLAMPYGDVYPNVFVLWLATTTLWRKTTGLDVARNLAQRAFPHLLAPQDTTPEGFLGDLSGREPRNFSDLPDHLKELWRQERNFAAQRGLVLDELSGLMAGAGKDYNAGLLEAFLRFYDCDPLYTRSTSGAGRIIVQNAYLAMLGASTPAAMAEHITSDRLWANGWWARFALLTPEGVRPEWKQATDHDPGEEERIIGELRGLYNALPAATWPTPPEAHSVILGPGVMPAWERYNKALSYDLLTPDLDNRLYGAYGRLPTQALKVATILAALDWQGSDGCAPTIKLAHLARAMTITETWRASAHRALTEAAASDFDRMQKRILRVVGKYDAQGGVTLRDLYRQMGDKTPDAIKVTVAQMVEVELLEELKVTSGTTGGRPTSRYRVVRG